MSSDYDNTVRTLPPGFLAPADGNYSGSAVAQAFRPGCLSSPNAATATDRKSLTPEGASYRDNDRGTQVADATNTPIDLGPNNERDMKPELERPWRLKGFWF